MFYSQLASLKAATNSAMAAAGLGLQPKVAGGRGAQTQTWILLAAACALLPLEISHLASLVIGALGYMLLQTLHGSVEVGRAKSGGGPPSQRSAAGPRSRAAPATRPERLASAGGAARSAPAEVRKPSAMPVAAPTFHAAGWEAEVEELLQRVAPTPESERAVAHIAGLVRHAVSAVAPDVEVQGFAGGNLLVGAAFGVAVPEVDIVVSAKPEALFGRLQGRWSQASNSGQRLDARKLQKSAIRACTEKLVGTGAFKFRRSAFRGTEPKVTLIAPPTPGTPDQGVPVSLLVNAQTPLRNAALIAKCGAIEPVALRLQLLVKRWAKDRGLSHVAKGHLSPYAWTLLTLYFLQVGRDDQEGPRLPPLAGLEVAPGLRVRGAAAGAPAQHDGAGAATGALFKEFVRFYTRVFDWQKEAVSVRLGKRAAPDLSVPLHIIVQDDGIKTEVGPSIEDPFEQPQNLGDCMTAASLARLHEELKRAEELCSSGASLTRLLEPWAPPEVAAGQEEAEDN